MLGIAYKRELPKLSSETLWQYYTNNTNTLHKNKTFIAKIYVFCDEFTNYFDVNTGISTLKLLSKVGFHPVVVAHEESGRSAISKGLLPFAKEKANQNIEIFKNLVSDESPLIGIEPSAIISFRDEYKRLADDKEAIENLARNTFTIEEFLKTCIDKNIITDSLFTHKKRNIKIHAHCHQKALSSSAPTFAILNLPKNYNVTILNTGCCGMAGSFGYEEEHYDISMQIGEDSLFPKLRKLENDTIIAAAGTSCRHQITDGVNKKALHPVEILFNALIE